MGVTNSDENPRRRKLAAQLGNLRSNPRRHLFDSLQITADRVDPRGDAVHFGLLHSPGGEGGGPQPDTAGDKWFAGIAGHHVEVGDDARLGQCLGHILSRIGGIAEVQHEQVGIGAAADEAVSFFEEFFGEAAGVGDHLAGVIAEGGGGGLLKGHGHGGDDVHVRSPLQPGEHRPINPFGQVEVAFGEVFALPSVFDAGEDEACPGSAEHLVAGTGDHVAMGNGVGMHAADNEAVDVGDVGDEVGLDFLGDFGEGGVIEDAGVGGCADPDHAGAFLARDVADLVVIKESGVRPGAVVHGLVVHAGEIDLPTVGEVSAGGDGHAHDFGAGGGEGAGNGLVGRGAGVRLDVGVFRAEEGFEAIDGELLDLVHEFIALVIAGGGVSFAVFVGEDGAGGLKDREGGIVFRGDHLEGVGFVAGLGEDEGVEFGVLGLQVRMPLVADLFERPGGGSVSRVEVLVD